MTKSVVNTLQLNYTICQKQYNLTMTSKTKVHADFLISSELMFVKNFQSLAACQTIIKKHLQQILFFFQELAWLA